VRDTWAFSTCRLFAVHLTGTGAVSGSGQDRGRAAESRAASRWPISRQSAGRIVTEMSVACNGEDDFTLITAATAQWHDCEWLRATSLLACRWWTAPATCPR
jgi:hypothetical protein